MMGIGGITAANRRAMALALTAEEGKRSNTIAGYVSKLITIAVRYGDAVSAHDIILVARPYALRILADEPNGPEFAAWADIENGPNWAEDDEETGHEP